MKLGQIAAAVPALQKLSGERLTPRVLYRLSKLMRKVESELEFYNRQRDEIVRQYGEHVKDTEYRIPAKNRAEFDQKMRELNDIDVEGEVSPVVIPTSENISLSYNDLRLLDGLAELSEDTERVETTKEG